MFEILLPATAKATVGKVVGTALDKPLGKLAEQVQGKVEAQPLAAAVRAVQSAVEAARQELIAEHWKGEDALSRDVVALLQHPPFAEEVTQRLLFRGRPDFSRLRAFYLETADDEAADNEAGSARWAAMQPALEALIDAIELHLQADPHLGPLLRDVDRLASLARLEERGALVAEASRSIEASGRAIAEATERTAEAGAWSVALQTTLVDAFLVHAKEQSVHLGQITALLQGLADGQRETPQLPAAADRLTPEEQRYLRHLAAECDHLPLADDPRAQGDRDEQASLARVYVDLDVTARPTIGTILDRLGVFGTKRRALLRQLEGMDATQLTEGRTPGGLKRHPLRSVARDDDHLRTALGPLTALEALAGHREAVLLGDPGSGKSTFVSHLAVTFARALLGAARGWRETLGEVFEAHLFPVRVVLRRWSAALQGDGEDALLGALAALPGGVPAARWRQRLDDPQTLVLLDGLDEVPAANQEDDPDDRRRRIVAAVEAFRTAYPRCRLLLTCRVKPYEERRYRLQGPKPFTLAPLGAGKIERFSGRWYDELVRLGRLDASEAERRQERLREALAARPGLKKMAGTPLLLTMLARVNARKELPEDRAQLYEDCVEQLLWEWERGKHEEVGGPKSLDDLLQAPDVGRQRADVERVLWQLAYEVHGGGGRDTADLPAAKLESALATVHPDRHEGKAWASRVVALMAERGGLLVARDEGIFTFPHRGFQELLAARWLLAQGDLTRAARHHGSDDIWREVLLLACGLLRADGRFGEVEAVVAALVAQTDPSSAEPEAWRRLLVAGQAWLEFDPGRAAAGQGEKLKDEMPHLLTRLMQNAACPGPQRLAAGLLAADLGAVPEGLDSWVAIPAEGSSRGFKIAKYPVTVGQFQRFVADGGKWGMVSVVLGDPRSSRATVPVTEVSRHDIAAYCTWLTEILRREGKIAAEEEVRLPTEGEWMRAAVGEAGRRYPWGDAFDACRLNGDEGVGQLSPVNMYPGGATPDGAFDLCGNVWEWTLTDAGESGRKLLVGGSWAFGDIEKHGAAARVRGHPDDWVGFIGFRPVVAPISS